MSRGIVFTVAVLKADTWPPQAIENYNYFVEIYNADTGFVHQYRDDFKSHAEAHSYAVSQTNMIRAKSNAVTERAERE